MYKVQDAQVMYAILEQFSPNIQKPIYLGTELTYLAQIVNVCVYLTYEHLHAYCFKRDEDLQVYASLYNSIISIQYLPHVFPKRLNLLQYLFYTTYNFFVMLLC